MNIDQTDQVFLEDLSRDQLIKLINELREDKKMRAIFSQGSELGSNDATLMWQGRNRFLAETVTPVSIKRDGGEVIQKI